MEQTNNIENIETEIYNEIYSQFLKECTIDVMNKPWVYTKQEVSITASKKINRKVLSKKYVKTEKERLNDLIESSYYIVENQRTTNYVIKIQVASYNDEKDPNILYDENDICYKKSDLLLDKKFRSDIVNFYKRISNKIFVKFLTGENKKMWMIMLCWN